jgi:hypothetical protein
MKQKNDLAQRPSGAEKGEKREGINPYTSLLTCSLSLAPICSILCAPAVKIYFGFSVYRWA